MYRNSLGYEPARRLALLLSLVAAGCIDDTNLADPPAEFISARRAWAPGERDSAIARVMREGGLGLFSDLAPAIFTDPDSYTTIVENPQFRSVSPLEFDLRGTRSPEFATNWMIAGVDVRIFDSTQTPADLTIWRGIFWSKTSPPAPSPSEPTWKGFIFGAGSAGNNVLPTTAVVTTTFDNNAGDVGAGGGESRLVSSVYNYWQAEGLRGTNTVQITGGSYGAPTTITSGPFTGGSQATGGMQGRVRDVRMFKQLPTPSLTDSVRVDFDFRGFPIQAVRMICVYRVGSTQCSSAAQAILAAQRQGRLAEFMLQSPR